MALPLLGNVGFRRFWQRKLAKLMFHDGFADRDGAEIDLIGRIADQG